MAVSFKFVTIEEFKTRIAAVVKARLINLAHDLPDKESAEVVRCEARAIQEVIKEWPT